jgi:hypothetical protein
VIDAGSNYDDVSEVNQPTNEKAFFGTRGEYGILRVPHDNTVPGTRYQVTAAGCYIRYLVQKIAVRTRRVNVPVLLFVAWHT